MQIDNLSFLQNKPAEKGIQVTVKIVQLYFPANKRNLTNTTGILRNLKWC